MGEREVEGEGGRGGRESGDQLRGRHLEHVALRLHHGRRHRLDVLVVDVQQRQLVGVLVHGQRRVVQLHPAREEMQDGVGRFFAQAQQLWGQLVVRV